MKSISIKVIGTVQGVGFRAFVSRQAEALELKGMVKNESDGSVYLEIEGDSEKVEEMIKRCKEGPSWSSVEDIFISEKKPQYYDDFSIQR